MYIAKLLRAKSSEFLSLKDNSKGDVCARAGMFELRRECMSIVGPRWLGREGLRRL